MILTWLALALSPIPSDDRFGQIRQAVIFAFALLTLLMALICLWLFRTAPHRLLPAVERWVALVANRWVALGLGLLALEINLFVFFITPAIAPTITGPLKFLMVWWSILWVGIIATVHWRGILAWFGRTQPFWAALGIGITALSLLSGVYFLTYQLVARSGIEARLRGSLDNRPLTFLDDGQAPTPQQFWAEQAQTRVQWLPYLYWTVEPFDGAYIHVMDNGLRYTPSYIVEGTPAERLYFFGGSTMWGEGARDPYTIAGHIARLLADSGQPQYVENYGQTGYVSTQEMLLFQFQLANDNIPDVAVFYNGFNDLYSAYLQDTSGIPYRENNRISDAEAGRLLRAGQPVFRLPDGDIARFDWSLVGPKDATAQTIVNRWLANARMIQALADEYQVKVLFVWQPSLIFKESLSGDEAAIRQRIEDESPGFSQLYREADAYLRQQVASQNQNNILILSDLFAEDERPIFHDLVHITEEGNLTVAETLLPHILEQLR